MFKFFNKLFHLPSYLVIVCLWLIIVITNYTPETWLIGWDNLLPELDFGINISRTLTPVWQESQGFGLLGGIAHAAEITHILFLWILSGILPPNMLRYAWTFGMVLAGGLGTYHLLLTIIKNHFQYTKSSRLPSLVAAIFYIFNPATVQNFYVPLEAFSSFYGFLPWIILLSLEHMYCPSTKNLLKLFVMLIIASSAFHVQTMFIVLCMVWAVFITEIIIKEKQKSSKLLLYLAIVIFGATAFWFLPVGFFAASSADATILSKQNQLATAESHLLNQSFGGFFDTITHRGYWLEYTDLIDGKTTYMFAALREHLYNPLISLIQVILALASLTGIILTTFQKRALFRWSFLSVAILSLGMLSAGSGVLGLIFKSITEGFPLFYQMFRVTFTKWSIVYSLLASVGIGVFLFYLKQLSIKVNKSFSVTAVATLLSFLAVITVWPILRGQFFYDQVQLAIPQPYFSLFTYLKNQPEQNRILMLPAHSFWDWRFHTWGYRGSGFVWYGIKQPIIDRNFDVWSRTNETFYTQLSHAIYDEDVSFLARLLRQYDVSYIVIDESVTIPNGTTEVLKINQTKEMLESLQLKDVWNEGFLHVYEVPNNNSFISQPDSYTQVTANTRMLPDNPAFRNEGDYISSNTEISESIIYPFASLTRLNQDTIDIVNNTVRYQYELPTKDNYSLNVPKLEENKPYVLPLNISYSSNQLQLDFEPLAKIESGLQSYVVESLGSHTIEVDQSYEQIYVDINNQILILGKDKPRRIFIQVEADEAVPITVADAKAARFENNRISLASVDLIKSNISANNWQHLLNEKQIDVSGANELLEVILPTVENNINLDNTIPQQTQKCDVLNRGEAEVFKEYGNQETTAINRGAICHGWELDQANTSDFHLLRIKGENLSGRPLKVFIEHLGKHIIVQEFLTPKGSYDSIYSIPSWNDDSFSTYALNVETRSMGGEKAENKITSIIQYPLPVSTQWLTDFSLIKDDIQPLHQNNGTILNIVKVGTYSYIFAVESQSESIFVLEQAFSPGWVAITGGRLLPHAEYNGWANAWTVPQGKSKVTLIYLPQLIHFGGIGVLLVTFIYMLINRKKLQKTFDDLTLESGIKKTISLKHLTSNIRRKLDGTLK